MSDYYSNDQLPSTSDNAARATSGSDIWISNQAYLTAHHALQTLHTTSTVLPTTSVQTEAELVHQVYVPPTLPIITSCSTNIGPPGSSLSIGIVSFVDLTSEASVARKFSIVFGNQLCRASVMQTPASNGFQHMLLSCTVPSPNQYREQESSVPLSLQVLDEYDSGIALIPIGTFIISAGSNGTPPLTIASRKRRQQADHSGYPQDRRKRSVSQQAADSADHASHTGTPDPEYTSPHLGSVSPATHRVPSPFNRADVFQQDLLGPASLDAISTCLGVMDSQRLSPSNAPSTRSGSIPPGITLPAGTMLIGYPSAERSSSNPTLVRTTSVRPSSTASLDALNPQQMNPYSICPAPKAMLELDGDLDGMVDDWTKSEWSKKRRLVEFQREQVGSIIKASFKPVTIESRTPNSICVSCILWEEKEECYITSVDTIYLLESLVAVRFTVEEKNRIRRNLEGFHPVTISKMKADSKSFFDVIMKFGSPKPRHIEKDVKAFPWRILSQALKKIIGKYTASYPSTTTAMETLSTADTSYASSIQYSDSEPGQDPSQSGATPCSTAMSTRRSHRTRSASAFTQSSEPGSLDVTQGGKPAFLHYEHLRQSNNHAPQNLTYSSPRIFDNALQPWSTIQPSLDHGQMPTFTPAPSGSVEYAAFPPDAFGNMFDPPQQLVPSIELEHQVGSLYRPQEMIDLPRGNSEGRYFDAYGSMTDE